jgi:hypothetical protein
MIHVQIHGPDEVHGRKLELQCLPRIGETMVFAVIVYHDDTFEEITEIKNLEFIVRKVKHFENAGIRLYLEHA